MVPDSARPVRRMLHGAHPAGPSGLTITKRGDAMASRAAYDGYYTTTDEGGREHRFIVRKGDVMPPGATFVAAEDETAATESAPKAAKKTKAGPSETAESAGPSEATD